jgi:hypothetical protein
MRPEKWLNSREQLYIPSQHRCAFCDSDLDLIIGQAGRLRFCSRAHERAYWEIGRDRGLNILPFAATNVGRAGPSAANGTKQLRIRAARTLAGRRPEAEGD